MKRKISLTILITLTLLLTLSSISATDEGSFTDLQNIIDTNTNGTISLDKDYSYNSQSDNIFTQLGVTITKDLTIDGNGHTLNGKDASRILRATNGNITIYNTIFTNGYSTEGGAAIHSQEENPSFTIINCSFTNNIGTTGTAISAYGKVTVTDSTFTNNDGIRGTAIYSHSQITVTNSKFENNKAVQEYNAAFGGAIYSDENISITNSTFTNNTGSKGGAIYTVGNLEVYDSTFTKNIADINGGGIYAVGDITVKNTIFTQNTANSANTFEESKGGAIYTDSNANIENSQFTNNYAKYYGGAIFAENTATIKNSKLENNKVGTEDETRGGAISTNNKIEATNNTFTKNTATLGGALDSILITSQNNTYQENTAQSKGGAIYTTETLTITNDQYIKNTADTGGAISSDSNIITTNTEYIENTANTGGAIHAQGDININNTTLTKNTANENGGAIYTENTLTIRNSKLQENKAANGGATYSQTANIKQTSFSKNTASQEGGAIYISDTHNPIQINYNTFKDNTAINGSSIKINLPTINDNINYNWWATNTPNFQRQTYTKTPTNYIIMEATSNQNMITTSLNRLNIGTTLTEQLPTTTVNYASNTGTFSSQTQEFTGTTSTLYQPTTNGTHTVYVTIDNQVIVVPLNITNPINNTNHTDNDTNHTDNDTKNIITHLTLENLNKIYGTDAQLTGTLTGENNEGISGQHIQLTLTRPTSGASKTYDVITDYTGTYTLPINLAPGNYTAEAKYNGLSYKNITYLPTNPQQATITVTISPTVPIATEITINQYIEPKSSTKPLTGTLLTSYNSPIPGQHVQLTLTRPTSGASKTYDVVTDYTGTYTLPINLAPGTYLIQCTYAGIPQYYASTNTATLIVTP